MLNPRDSKKMIIGHVEYIDLPDFNINNIKAKIDTGAYSGSIHVNYIKRITEGGCEKIQFSLLDENHPEFKNNIYTIDTFQTKKIKSSNGHSELRYIIPIKIILKNKVIDTKLSLSDRTEMRYPILLGRKFIKNLFLIDVSKKFTE